MRILLASLSVLVFTAAVAAGSTALNALRVLLPEQVQNVALITAREGVPEPERWHVIVYDPTSDNGVREYVIAGGKRVASRPVSQFVEKLTPADVVGPAAVKVDSDKVVKTALQFGVANNKAIAAMHFDLRKNPSDGTPVWTVICTNLTGTELGRVVISANRGEVLSHLGFDRAPPLETVAEQPEPPPATKPERTEPTRTAPRRASVPVKTATPLPVATPKPPLFRRLFGRDDR